MMRGLSYWLPAYLRQPRSPAAARMTDLLIAVCDHFEPLHAANRDEARQRLAGWRRELPKLIAPFQDADGVRPRHTFFYPIEQYDPAFLEELAVLGAETGAEVEIHLHHDADSAEQFQAKIERGKQDLARHGLLCRDAAGSLRYGFIHGDWALDNSHPSGRHCGVRNELAALRATGCYADFTMPSAPSPTQARTINRLYYARGTDQPRSYDTGATARVEPVQGDRLRQRPDHLLMVQGPLGLNWGWRKLGVLPRIETGDLTGANPPQAHRLRVWRRLGIHVAGRPEWVFVKLHTHGAIPQNSGMLLGEPMRAFHQCLLATARTEGFRIHYVTAREMVNILHAAEDGSTGNPGAQRNYLYRR